MSETVNPGVEGSAEPPAGLVEAVARALGGPMMMRCDGCDGCVWTRCTSCPQPSQPCACAGVPGADPELARIAIAAVRAYDAERTSRNVVVRDKCPCCDEVSGGGYCAECIERGCP